MDQAMEDVQREREKLKALQTESEMKKKTIEDVKNGIKLLQSNTAVIKEKAKEIDTEIFHKYLAMSSVFPLVGLYFSFTCERKMSRLGAQIGGGISCIVYGVYMVAASMFYTSSSYYLALQRVNGNSANAEALASSLVSNHYYIVMGLPGWASIVLGSWVVHTSIGNHYRGTGERIVSLAEMDKKSIKRCFLPVFGILISSVLYRDSETKFLTGVVGSSCSSIAFAPVMFLIGANSPKYLVTCALLFLLFSIVGGVGLGLFWWKLRVLVLSLQSTREFRQKGGVEVDTRDYQIGANSSDRPQASQFTALQVEGNFSNLIDNAQEPSEVDAYVPPAPSSHVAIQDYRAQEEDEMNFQNGDLIGIEKDFGDGWAIGQNISKNRKSGVFPLALVTAIVTGPTQNVSRMKTSFLPRTISMKVKL